MCDDLYLLEDLFEDVLVRLLFEVELHDSPLQHLDEVHYLLVVLLFKLPGGEPRVNAHLKIYLSYFCK
jgi:hypothetical protein